MELHESTRDHVEYQGEEKSVGKQDDYLGGVYDCLGVVDVFYPNPPGPGARGRGPRDNYMDEHNQRGDEAERWRGVLAWCG